MKIMMIAAAAAEKASKMTTATSSKAFDQENMMTIMTMIHYRFDGTGLPTLLGEASKKKNCFFFLMPPLTDKICNVVFNLLP